MSNDEPFCFANINKQGDVTRTSKRRDGWAKTPLYLRPKPAEPVKVPTDDQWQTLMGWLDRRRIYPTVQISGEVAGDIADRLARYGQPAQQPQNQPQIIPENIPAEVQAWRERFPAHEYRPQDECIALKLKPQEDPQPAASADPAIDDDIIYLGCARMGLAGADDEEVLNYVRSVKRRTGQDADHAKPIATVVILSGHRLLSFDPGALDDLPEGTGLYTYQGKA